MGVTTEMGCLQRLWGVRGGGDDRDGGVYRDCGG